MTKHIAALLPLCLLAVVFAESSFDPSSSVPLLRGNGKSSPITANRVLQTDPVTITTTLPGVGVGVGAGAPLPELGLLGLGKDELRCEEHGSKDGSIVCSFRTMLPNNLDERNVLADCLHSSTLDNTNYCVKTEVYRTSYFDAVPPEQQLPEPEPKPPVTTLPEVPPDVPVTLPEVPPDVPVTLPEVPPRPLPEIFLRQDGCPQQVPNTSMGCWMYAPPKATATATATTNNNNKFTCTYSDFRLKCDCELVDDTEVREVWSCYQYDPQQEVTPPPPPPPVVLPETEPVQTPVTGIDADVTSGISPPQQNPNPPELFLPIINNQPYCTLTQAGIEGTECEGNKRCLYWVEDENGNTLYANSCDCAWKTTDTFLCRPSQNPIFNPNVRRRH